MAKLFDNLKHKNIVAYRLLIYILVFSSTISLLTISLQLYVDYRNDIAFIDDQMNQIHNSRLDSIALSIWEIHYGQLESQLQGILSIRDIEYIHLEMFLEDDVIAHGVRPAVRSSISREFPLQIIALEEEKSIGKLLVIASTKGVYERLKNKLFLIIISQFFKTFLVAFFILYIFYHLVTRHLSSMALFTRNLSADKLTTPLTLEKKTINHPLDELDIVVNSINSMRVDLLEYITEQRVIRQTLRENEEHLEELVAVRTQELRKVNADFSATNKELKEFAHIVSHDLKAPLRAISQLTHWISEDYSEKFDEDGKMQMGMILQRVKRMDGLIDGILRYSRVGQIREKSEQLNLNKLLANVVDSLAPPENIQVVIDDDLPVISGDSIRMEQIFQNLISNAIKYMDKAEGLVKIECSKDGQFWKFSVADNGPGIAPKYHDKIFQIFQTLRPRDEHESTGIGLSIVKKIIGLYNGSVWVESAQGNGSTFFFTLPLKGDHNANI